MLDQISLEDRELFFRSGKVEIRKFSALGSSRAKEAIVLFSSWGETVVDGMIKGTDVLLGDGYDVFCVHCIGNDWFQTLPREVLCALSSHLAQSYERRLGYGMSMGGYGAIVFADILKFDRVLAMAPQFNLDEDFDPRAVNFNRGIEWVYDIPREAGNYSGEIFIIYDPLNFDKEHVRRIVEACPKARFHEQQIRFSGHLTGRWLAGAGILSEQVSRVFGAGEFLDCSDRKFRRDNGWHNALYARHLADKGKTASSMKFARRSLELGDGSPELYRVFSDLNVSNGDLDGAIRFAEKAVAASQDTNVRGFQRVHLSNLLRRAGRADEALAAFGTGEEDQDLMQTEALAKCRVLLDVGLYRPAFDIAKRACDQGAKTHAFFRVLSAACHKLGRLVEAEDHVRTAIGLSDTAAATVSHKIHRSTLLRLLGQHEAAVALVDTVIAGGRGNWEAYFVKSRAQASLQNRKAALETAERALDLGAASPGLLRFVSELHQGLGSMDKAIEFARSVANIDGTPAQRAVHGAHLGNLLRINGDCDDGLAIVDGLIAEGLDTAAVLRTKSHLLYDLDRPDEALAPAEAAVRKYEPDPDALRHLGTLFYRTGDLKTAVAYGAQANEVSETLWYSPAFRN